MGSFPTLSALITATLYFVRTILLAIIAALIMSSGAAAADVKTAVVLQNFSDNTSQPWTPSEVNGALFTNSNSASAFWRESSYGAVNWVGDVYGWYTMPYAMSPCDYAAWMAYAKNRLTSQGVDISQYQKFIVVLPWNAVCGWSGLGEGGAGPGDGGTHAWLNGGIGLRPAAHEMGHLLGFMHAVGVNNEGDPFDIMGYPGIQYHTSAVNRGYPGVNWIAPFNVTNSGTYSLAPALGTTGTRLLSIVRPDGTKLHLEFRQPQGLFDNFSPTDPAVNGIQLRNTPPTFGNPYTRLIDTHPSTTSLSDAPLRSGETYFDPAGVSVKLLSYSSFGAQVEVNMNSTNPPPPPPPTPTPTPTSTPTPTPTPQPGVPQCSDGRDNDGDGRVDMADKQCMSPSDNNEQRRK